ncbi:uncharacterized protein KY384_004839 [Bacidia gigantensis]|uniref:uncharacterized protein n=1 Tax=Bacidia gigantensis TaxID=2732470 RepID=UPI001D04F743|nr:uncharacterized protein KY384_004839 [Bacidia gigantensis]KAG8530337.1 hypothetical protein KY384_004839 [Bacidia gigantensis]
MNLSGTRNAFRLFTRPSLAIPHITVPTFDKIQVPIAYQDWPEIKAVVLDRDNTFAVKGSIYVHKQYKETFESLRRAYPGPRLLIVSNSVGTDKYPISEVEFLEEGTGVKVFRHSIKKPGCGKDVFDYFRSNPDVNVTKPSEIAVIGDRLLTDVMMGNVMGMLSIWVRDGIIVKDGTFMRLEKGLPAFLGTAGFKSPAPS